MDREDLIIDLNDHYSKKTLIILLEYMDFHPGEHLNKKQLINMVIDGLYNRERFNILWGNISNNAKIVLGHLTWEGISTLGNIDSKYHIKISLEDFYGNTDDPFIKNFKQYYSKEILLSTGLRDLLKKCIKSPIIKFLEPDGEIIKSDNFVYENLNAIEEFIKFQNIRARGLSKKLLLKSINVFKKNFNLNSEFSEIRTTYILKFFMFIKSSGNPMECLKAFLTKYKNGSLIDENIDQYLYYPHIKGCNSNPHLGLFLKRGRFSFINKIRSYDSDKWIGIKSLVREQSLEEDTQIFDTTYFGNLLSVKVDPDIVREYLGNITLTLKSDNEEYLLNPMLQGIVTMLYSIGAADFIFNSGEITHFKLTDLGRKLLGLSSNFVEIKKESFMYSFHDKKLIILTEGKNSAKLNFFERIGHSLGNGLFLISYKEFMKECNSDTDIEYNIRELTDLFPEDVAGNWLSFISDINDRLKPTYNEQELIVVNFPQDNREFVNLILENSRIRDLFLMVEGFRGAFSLNNYKQFKKIMKEEGFFL